MTEDLVEDIVKRADANNDNMMDKEEFKQLLTRYAFEKA